MICACHAPIVCCADTYVGTQIYADSDTREPWLTLALFNCRECGSTRAAILFDAVPTDADEELEAIAIAAE